jgi:hypothetical protein
MRTSHPSPSRGQTLSCTRGEIILQERRSAANAERSLKNARVILRDGMHKTRAHFGLALVLGIVLLVLAMTGAAASSGIDGRAGQMTVGPQQEVTPTPTETSTSVAGSTDSIMWMGLAIVLIALLPLITRPSFWR